MAGEHATKDRRGTLLWLRVRAAETDEPFRAVLTGRQRTEVRAHVPQVAADGKRRPFNAMPWSRCWSHAWGDPNAEAIRLQEPLFARFVDILRSRPKPDRGLRTLLGRLEELADYGFFELAERQESLWQSDQPIVIRIHTTQNDNLQKAFASLVFYGLYKDMFRRGIQSRITHAVVFDEAHRAAKLRLIPTMAKECRKYGISLVLASQEAKDFNISLFSAIANYLVLRLNEVDAKGLVRNVASSDQERALIDKIKQMERFKALYFCEGKKKPSPVSLRQS